MTIEFKILVTVILIMLGSSVWHVNSKDTQDADKEGKLFGRQLDKRILLRNDGTLSLFARSLISIFFILGTLFIWIAA